MFPQLFISVHVVMGVFYTGSLSGTINKLNIRDEQYSGFRIFVAFATLIGIEIERHNVIFPMTNLKNIKN